MGKERSELIFVTSPSNTPEDICKLLYEVTLLKKTNPKALILAKSPRTNRALTETLFAAGANAWAKLASPEEGPPEPPAK